MGLLVLAILVVGHVFLAPCWSLEVGRLLIALLVGVAWENLSVALGVVAFPGPSVPIGFAPAWMVGLWVLFGTTWGSSLQWLAHRPGVAALLGGVFGPLSYGAGVRLGAAEFPDPAFSVVGLAGAWAVVLPAALAASERLACRLTALPVRASK